jgi:hypothetical protein
MSNAREKIEELCRNRERFQLAVKAASQEVDSPSGLETTTRWAPAGSDGVVTFIVFISTNVTVAVFSPMDALAPL